MIGRHAWLVFRKDGRELLRDRRALVVSLVLPTLLYPLLLLFALQVAQLAKLQARDLPKVGAVHVPAKLMAELQKSADGLDLPVAPTAAQPVFALVDLGHDATQLGAQVPQLAQGLGKPVDAAAKAKIAASLRARGLAQAVVLAGDATVLTLTDGANSRLPETDHAVRAALLRYHDALVADALQARKVDLSVLHPFARHEISAATTAEAVRTHAAPALPFIVLVLAVASAMAPATDLLAGERDRGTLETLLALPLKRRDVVVGKLLVVMAAALVAVLLNLLSLGATAGLLAKQLPAVDADSPLSAIFAVGLPALGLCLLMLLPVIALVAAAGVALSALAQSAKEAGTYLTPLMLAVTFGGIVVMVPTAQPTLALDLVPISGTLLALREALQSAQVPWVHVLVASAANLGAAAVVVGWCAQMFEKESFRYPGLVRAGWGRFAKWRRGPAQPDALEALAVFALAVGGMTLGGGVVMQWPPWAQAVVPLMAFVAAPALLHAWLGAYPWDRALGLRRPELKWLGAGLLLVPIGALLSYGVGSLQERLVDASALKTAAEPVAKIVAALDQAGGLPLLVLCLAVVPAVCEELLCRGTLLHGLQASLGSRWAVGLSALLFALLHQSPLRLVPQLLLGAVLGALTLRARSIWPAVALHAGHNALLLVGERMGWG